MHTPTRNPLILPAALALALTLAASAPAQQAAPEPERRVLIDRDLNTREISLLSITHDAIVYLDDQGRTRQASVGVLVALLPLDPPWDEADAAAPGSAQSSEQPDPRGVLELADGQRFPGEHAPTGGDEDAIIWAHPVFGRVAVNLDRVARAVLRPPGPDTADAPGPTRAAAPAGAHEDELILVNGDSISGFVISLGDPIEIDAAGEILAIPADRVADVRLANPPSPMRGLVVWLEDGSVVVVAAIDGRDGDSVELALPTGQTGVLPMRDLDAVAFRAGRLLGLAAITPESQSPRGPRRVGQPARVLDDPLYDTSGRLTAPDMELPGPMRIRWPLPDGARRFAAIAELPFDALPWGDCVLTVEIDDAPRAAQRLNAESPRFEINIPIDPGAQSITIDLDPGAWGPINDRVTLRRPLLLLDPNPS